MSSDSDSGLQMLEKNVRHDESNFKVTGICMQYLTVCKRELWLYMNGVDIDKNRPSIVEGTQVDKNTYKENKSTVVIDGMIAPDFLEDGTVVEVKPSSILEEASELQLLYYLWYLDHFKNFTTTGELAYPTERDRKKVSLTEENRERVVKAINDIYKVWNMDEPPELEKKDYCSSCAYQDICWL